MPSGASRATRDVRRAPMSRVGRAPREGRDPGILARCRVLDPRKQRPGSDGGRARVSVDAPPVRRHRGPPAWRNKHANGAQTGNKRDTRRRQTGREVTLRPECSGRGQPLRSPTRPLSPPLLFSISSPPVVQSQALPCLVPALPCRVQA